jgi:hypothetical protein
VTTFDEALDRIIDVESAAQMRVALVDSGRVAPNDTAGLLLETMGNNLEHIAELLNDTANMLTNAIKAIDNSGAPIPTHAAFMFGDGVGALQNARRLVLYSAKKDIEHAFKHRNCIRGATCTEEPETTPTN